MPPTPSGKGPDLVQTAKIRVRTNVTQEDLNQQALRNGELQEALLRLQVSNAKLDGTLKRVAIVAALTGGVYALEQGYEKWEDRCEKVDSEGRTTLVCPF